MNYKDRISLLYQDKGGQYIAVLNDDYRLDGSMIIEGERMDNVIADIMRADRWVTINGSHVLIDDKSNKIIAGMGGKFKGFPFGARFADKGNKTERTGKKIARLYVAQHGEKNGKTISKAVSLRRAKVRELIKKFKLTASGNIYDKNENNWHIVGPKIGLKRITNEEKEFLKNNRSLFFNEMNAYVSKKAKRIREVEKNKVASIKGLNEIEEARRIWNDYNYKFGKAIDRGDVVYPDEPTSPKPNVIAAKYPRASAYLQMENWQGSANYVKSDIGKRARQAILDGKNYKKVIANAEKEWDKYTTEHMWD